MDLILIYAIIKAEETLANSQKANFLKKLHQKLVQELGQIVLIGFPRPSDCPKPSIKKS